MYIICAPDGILHQASGRAWQHGQVVREEELPSNMVKIWLMTGVIKVKGVPITGEFLNFRIPDLSVIDGVDTAEDMLSLHNIGLWYVRDVAEATLEKVQGMHYTGPKRAKAMIDSAQAYLAAHDGHEPRISRHVEA